MRIRGSGGYKDPKKRRYSAPAGLLKIKWAFGVWGGGGRMRVKRVRILYKGAGVRKPRTARGEVEVLRVIFSKREGTCNVSAHVKAHLMRNSVRLKYELLRNICLGFFRITRIACRNLGTRRGPSGHTSCLIPTRPSRKLKLQKQFTGGNRLSGPVMKVLTL